MNTDSELISVFGNVQDPRSPINQLYDLKIYWSIEPKTFCAKEFSASFSTIPFATLA
jgi:hypothetical protein